MPWVSASIVAHPTLPTELGTRSPSAVGTAAVKHRWSCKEQGGHFVKKQLMLGSKGLDISGIYISLQNLPCPEPRKKMQVTVRARKKGKKE